MANAPAANPVPQGPVSGKLPAAPRILIIRFSSLGDVVKCTALPRLIKAAYPEARITMLTASDYLELIADNPHLSQAIGFDRREGAEGFRRLVKQLRAEPFDLIADVHHSLRSRLLGLFLRGRRTRYSKRSLQRLLLLSFRLNTYGEPMGKETDFLAGLEPYGVTDDGLGTELHLQRVAGDAALRQRLAAELEQIARWREAGRPVIGVAPIAAWELKRWPLANFRELMQAYVRKTGGGLVLFGGPGDDDAHGLVAGLEANAVSLVGRTSHLESAYFASLTDLVVANDTGMTHLAEAVGTDVLTLYGPTSRELGYYPVRRTSVALELPLPCRPCTRMGEGACHHPLHKACLVGITPQAVLGHVLAAIGRGNGAPGDEAHHSGGAQASISH
jgi:heptosyltransferase-2